MKVLVVYYSLEGNTKFIAEAIKDSINADILEIKLKKELNPKGFSKFIFGGKQVILKERPELVPLDKNEIIGEIGFKDPLKHAKQSNENKINQWAKDITSKI